MRNTIRGILDKHFLPSDEGLIELMYNLVINKKPQQEIAAELRYAIPPSKITDTTNLHVYRASCKLSLLNSQ